MSPNSTSGFNRAREQENGNAEGAGHYHHRQAWRLGKTCGLPSADAAGPVDAVGSDGIARSSRPMISVATRSKIMEQALALMPKMVAEILSLPACGAVATFVRPLSRGWQSG